MTSTTLAESSASVTTATYFGGLLQRHRGGWQWSDGTPEPRAFDMTGSEAFARFRVRGGYVLVPLGLADSEPWLAWVLTKRDTPYTVTAIAPGEALMVADLVSDTSAMVPLRDWTLQCRTVPVGARWADADLPALAAVAHSLGWRPER